ncbi:MAG: ATP synthase subunit I [Methylococcaceae bacterium]
MTGSNLSTVSKVLSYQILVIIIITILFAVLGGWQKGLSPVLGGGAALIPNIYFALRIQRAAGQNAKKILDAFYAGEAGKLLLTAALFVIIFQIPNIEILPLLAGYAAALSVFWFALLMR